MKRTSVLPLVFWVMLGAGWSSLNSARADAFPEVMARAEAKAKVGFFQLRSGGSVTATVRSLEADGSPGPEVGISLSIRGKSVGKAGAVEQAFLLDEGIRGESLTVVVAAINAAEHALTHQVSLALSDGTHSREYLLEQVIVGGEAACYVFLVDVT